MKCISWRNHANQTGGHKLTIQMTSVDSLFNNADTSTINASERTSWSPPFRLSTSLEGQIDEHGFNWATRIIMFT